jgi:hypothetical protein
MAIKINIANKKIEDNSSNEVKTENYFTKSIERQNSMVANESKVKLTFKRESEKEYKLVQ